MIAGEDYKFRDDMKHDTVPIELLTEPYRGVILRYTTVSVQEQEEGDAKLRFDYELLETGDNTMIGLRKDDRFQQHVGLILNAMILESLEVPDNDLGEHYTEEPDNE